MGRGLSSASMTPADIPTRLEALATPQQKAGPEAYFKGVVGIDSDLDNAPPAQVRMVDGDFFAMLGLRASAGRTLSDEDRAGAEPVCVVNRAFVGGRRIEGDAVGLVGQRVRQVEVSGEVGVGRFSGHVAAA